MVGDHGGCDFVHLEAPVSLRNLGRTEPEFTGFFQQVASDEKILVLHLLDVGDDLIDGELLRCLANEQVLFGEVFGREDFVGLALFEKKAAAGDLGLRNCGRCRHV